jgi:hypothetical protein
LTGLAHNRFQPEHFVSGVDKGNRMKIAHRLLITAGLLTALASTAMAQTAPSAEGLRSAHMEKKHEHRAQRHHHKLTDLKTKLKLQAGQEAAWTAFEQAMPSAGRNMPHPDTAVLNKLSTPERIAQMQAFKAQHDAQMQKRIDATQALYAGLDGPQRKTFDDETARTMTQHMGRHMKGSHHAAH